MTHLFYSVLKISVIWEILLSKHCTSRVTFAVETKKCGGTDFNIIFNFHEYDFTNNSLLITTMLGKKL